MSSISGSGSAAQFVILKIDNPTVAVNTAMPAVVQFDPAGRWNSVTHRLTAVAAEVWRVRNADSGFADKIVSALRNGVSVGRGGERVIDDTPADLMTVVNQFGVTYALAPGDYIDLRAGAAGAVGTFFIVLERLA